MKIAVCGVNNPELLNKVAKHYNVEPVGKKDNIYEAAKVTYDYDNVENVVFNGSTLDYAEYWKEIHLLDEQIILCSLNNLDVVYVYTVGMSTEDIERYHQYDEFLKVRVIDVTDINSLIIE